MNKLNQYLTQKTKQAKAEKTSEFALYEKEIERLKSDLDAEKAARADAETKLTDALKQSEPTQDA